MKATSDFTACINGTVHVLKKGEEFKGDTRAQAHLEAIGLIAKAKERKAASNER